ncbi:MAG: hypothetical protein ACHQPI_06795 [Thermoanaerobaculia bacterium]
MAKAEPLSLQVRIDPGPGANSHEIEEGVRSLRREIAGLPVESVEFVHSGPAPAGTRSPEILTAGMVAVTLLTPILPKLIEVINAWLSRGKDRDVEITIRKGDEILTVKVPADADRGVVLSFVDDLRERLGGNGKRPSA